MKTYNDLVDNIAELHQKSSPTTGFAGHPLTVSRQWIPAVVDSTSAGIAGKQPIIVAFGANYVTHPNTPPNHASAVNRSSAPWIEQKLGSCRVRAINLLNACSKGKGHVKHHWNGHGNAEIYGIFRLMCWKLGLKKWFFDSNLSQKSLMFVSKNSTSRSTTHSTKPNPTTPAKGKI